MITSYGDLLLSCYLSIRAMFQHSSSGSEGGVTDRLAEKRWIRGPYRLSVQIGHTDTHLSVIIGSAISEALRDSSILQMGLSDEDRIGSRS